MLDQRQQDLTVVLENVFDPHNISAVLRSCDAVGIQDVYVLNTRIPPHRKWGHRSSGTASSWMTIHQFTDTGTCMSELKGKFARVLCSTLSDGSVNLFDLDLTGSLALIFGNEQEGVSAEVNHWADTRFQIPQVGMIRSLNISVACAVTLYEAFRQRSLEGSGERRFLDPLRRETLLRQWSREADIPLSNENNTGHG
ncbi:MAG TPA: RNA methyltransferase [Chitinophagaceae bacterium]|nr:RNA methyltransferase [Chitinophagaceae bacterium]